MKNKATFWLYILIGLGYAWGVILIASLVFMPIGIYFISGAMFYRACLKLTDSELYCVAKKLKYWAIFFGIAMFPLGLLAFIPSLISTSNNIKVSTPGFDATDYMARVVDENASNTVAQNNNTISEMAEQKVLTPQEMEKFEELKRYKEQGLITDEEFDRAKNELFK